MKYLQVTLFALLGIICSQSLAVVEIDKGDHFLVCRGAIELGIVFDVSRSIPRRDFKTVKDAMTRFLKQFTIGPNAVRVGLIPFENEIHPDAGFVLDTYNSSAQVAAHVNALPHIGNNVRRDPAMTETRKALRYIRETMLTPEVTREGIERICLVMTDGNSQNRTGTAYEAQALRDAGVKVYAVGFGAYIRMTELITIAGDESRVRLERNFGNLDSIMADLSVDVCEKIPKPLEPPCEERDFVFVFSRSQLGHTLSAKAVDLVEEVSKRPEFATGHRFGLLSGVCPEDAGFELGNDVTKLEHFRQNHLTAIIESKNPFTYTGGKAEHCNIAVLVINNQGLPNLGENVAALKRNGAKEVLIWNLSDVELSVGNSAKVISGLTGTNPRKAALAIAREMTTEA